MSLKLGYKGEDQARDYLLSQGLRLRARNYRCRLGEIDLIMQDGEYLVFIEVRARSSSVYGNAVESITVHKRQKLLKTAALYLLSNKLQDKWACRFDVLSLDGVPPQIRWIKNAFGSDF